MDTYSSTGIQMPCEEDSEPPLCTGEIEQLEKTFENLGEVYSKAQPVVSTWSLDVNLKPPKCWGKEVNSMKDLISVIPSRLRKLNTIVAWSHVMQIMLSICLSPLIFSLRIFYCHILSFFARPQCVALRRACALVVVSSLVLKCSETFCLHIYADARGTKHT